MEKPRSVYEAQYCQRGLVGVAYTEMAINKAQVKFVCVFPP